MNECQSCGGQYEPISTDGVPYFHICGPLTAVNVKRGGKWIYVPLVELRGDDTIRVRRDDAVVETLVAEQQADDLRLGDEQVPRENPRDETPVIALVNGKPVSAPRAEGDGVAVAVVFPADPIVLTRDAV